MKKLFFFAIITCLSVITLTSCSSGRDDDPVVQPEKQDFTNANFIKATMQGTWIQVQFSYDGSTYRANDWNNKYVISGDNYTYTPYNGEFPNLIESGSYSIVPVTGDNNAVLKLNHSNNYVHHLTLLDYSGGIVTTSEPDATSPTGRLYFKFKKQ